MKIACYNINLNVKYIWRWASLISSSHQDHYHLSEKPLGPPLYWLACAKCNLLSRLGFLRDRGCFVSFSCFQKPLGFRDFSPHSHLHLHFIKQTLFLCKESNFLSWSRLKWALPDHRWVYQVHISSELWGELQQNSKLKLSHFKNKYVYVGQRSGMAWHCLDHSHQETDQTDAQNVFISKWCGKRNSTNLLIWGFCFCFFLVNLYKT